MQDQPAVRLAHEHSDVRLMCRDGEVHSFTCLLAAASPVLRAALSPESGYTEGSTRTYNVVWASKSSVEAFVAHATGVSLNITGENAAELLSLADQLQVASLHAVCERALIGLLTSSNASELLELARTTRCSKLQAVAQVYADDPTENAALRNLAEQKVKTNTKLEQILAEKQRLEREETAARRELESISEQESFERDRVFKAASAAHAAALTVAAPPELAYPHETQRVLVVTPDVALTAKPQPAWGLEAVRGKRRAHSDDAFASLAQAVEASRAGDTIQLLAGVHDCDDTVIIKHSLVIEGQMGAQVVLCSRSYNLEQLFWIKGSADVRLGGLLIDASYGVESEGIADVGSGQRLWVDNCQVWMRDAHFSVKRGGTAFFTCSQLSGSEASAIQIDPQALRVVITRCHISGAGEGSPADGFDEGFYRPGECGAIEVGGYNWNAIARPTHVASVEVKLEGNTITSNYGYGVSYRTKCKRKTGRFGSMEFHFEVPPGIMTMTGNVVTGNGLAHDTKPADGEELVENTQKQNGLADDDGW